MTYVELTASRHGVVFLGHSRCIRNADGGGSSATFAIRLNVCVSGRLTYLVHEWVMKISPAYILKVFYSGMLQSFSQFIFTGVLFFCRHIIKLTVLV